jgi:hypothetical protein
VAEIPKPSCPECGAPMRQRRRGATLKKRGPAWTCPLAEHEQFERPDLWGLRNQEERRARGAKHADCRWYEAADLEVAP